MISVVIGKDELRSFYNGASDQERYHTLTKLGPLRTTFSAFLDDEADRKRPQFQKIAQLFDSCFEQGTSVDGLYNVLRELSPGNGIVGCDEVNKLVDHLRGQVQQRLAQRGRHLQLAEHNHAFGSGGDFIKTIHATTSACIILAPLVRFCKTGTVNVTSHYGSSQIVAEMGYAENEYEPSDVNYQLSQYGFSFVSLSSLGVPYSQSLKAARKVLWDDTVSLIDQRWNREIGGWRRALQTTDVPLDILKIVSPNAQLLNPRRHSTGVCHLKMIPYVLSTFLHLDTEGVVTHAYDGIDEISNAAVDSIYPNNLVIRVGKEDVTILEFSPEDIGIARCAPQAISEADSIAAEAEEFWRILSGTDTGAKRDFLVANAGALLVANGKYQDNGDELLDTFGRCVEIVNDLIDSGKSYENFHDLVRNLHYKTA